MDLQLLVWRVFFFDYLTECRVTDYLSKSVVTFDLLGLFNLRACTYVFHFCVLVFRASVCNVTCNQYWSKPNKKMRKAETKKVKYVDYCMIIMERQGTRWVKHDIQ